MRLSRLSLFFALPFLLAISACGTKETSPMQPYPYVKLSLVSPPDTPYEEPLRSENPMQEIWRPGYWLYDGMSFNWIPGHLMPRPSPTSVWSPDHWEKRTYGYAFVEGYWQ